MQTREQVIEGLNDIHAVACGLGDDQCYLNSIGIKQLQTLINDATELLKAQEPRDFSDSFIGLSEQSFMLPHVMDVDTLKASQRRAVWLETRNGKVYTGWVLVYDHMTSGIVPGDRIGLTQPGGHNSWLMVRQYGKDWRCWDMQPTDEQRKTVKWE